MIKISLLAPPKASKLEIAYIYSIQMILISLPYSHVYTNIVVFLSSIISIAYLIQSNKSETLGRVLNAVSLSSIGYFLILLLSTIYAENKADGLYLVERSLLFLIFPITLSGIHNEYKSRLLLSFAYGMLIACLYCFIVAFFRSGIPTILFTQVNHTVEFHRFFYHELIYGINQHAVHISLYVSSAILILIHHSISYLNKIPFTKTLLHIGSALFLIIFNYLLHTAFGAIITTLGVLLLLLYHVFVYIKFRKRHLIIISLIFFLVSIPSAYVLEKKIDYTIDYKLSNKNEWDHLKLKLAQWQCSVEVIKENLLFGTGNGDHHQALMAKYQEKGFDYAYEMQLNPHNQYLQTWIIAGIPGILMLVTLFFVTLKTAFKHNDILYFLIIGSFCALSLIESTFQVQKGIVFFTLFSGVFYYGGKINK